jgi:hypothetical protein
VHHTFLEEPHVRITARLLSDALAESRLPAPEATAAAD